MTQPDKDSQTGESRVGDSLADDEIAAGASSPEWEVEQKYFVDDSEQLLQELADAGFTRSHEEVHCDMYFQHPSRDFRQTDEAFRLRRVNEQLCVTYKGQRLDAEVKTRREIELALVAKDEAHWQELLGHLGFRPLPEVRKTRVVFQPAKDDGQGFVVTLDQVDQLGQFAEIEKIVRDPAALSESQTSIEEPRSRLGVPRVPKLSSLAHPLQNLGTQ